MIKLHHLRNFSMHGFRLKPNSSCLTRSTRCFTSSNVALANKEDDVIPKNTLEPHITAHTQSGFGQIYDKKPFKIHLQANKRYKWCTCGWSKNQPFCDGTHKNPYMKIGFRPVHFTVEEDKEYYLCNCKQTAHRPFCDGTHKRQDIQDKIK
ncbi:CDGSH iron-sulfur domain-containing protein 3, mitochondrial [Macrosteles quadrilineatus]|uniref:CDGSH iron-sulfur domain-containing protein 3, mitochondrial n=1 Tax=Macrosteles quadrilineatus TaxID=74068 RepID=UPI0023E1E901|nr:CDGSH iron-sulfur domain-containing protein 3, mitochondrial [Macrosteles quadrilineatus]